MGALYKKELQFYLHNPIGYIVIVLFAVFANFLFVKDIFIVGEASMRPFFTILPWLLMVFIPALTMRVFAEEKRTNTMELLLSLPISEIQIVLAKFFALLTLSAIGLVLTLGLPISMYFLSQSVGSRIYLPEILTGYFGVLLLASSFISLGMFFSTLTDNQVVAFLVTIVSLFFLIIFSTDFVAGFLPLILQNGLNYLSPATHLEPFIKGLIDFRSFFYFLSMSILFLFLTVIDLERRK